MLWPRGWRAIGSCPLERQFAGPLRFVTSSFSGCNARWNLNLSSSLSNRKIKNNLERLNKKINRGCYSQCTWTTKDHSDRCPFACACSSHKRSFRNIPRTHDHERDIRKIGRQGSRQMAWSIRDASFTVNSRKPIFKI